MKALIIAMMLFTNVGFAYEQCWPAEDICLSEDELEMSDAEWDQRIELYEILGILESIIIIFPDDY